MARYCWNSFSNIRVDIIKMKLKLISVRVNPEVLEELKQKLGVDDSKTIRACMNCTKNVLLNTFGGEIGNIFRRKKTNEELDFYHKQI